MAKWLYRLESTIPEKGLWYNANGDLVWTIGELEDCITKFLPMDYDERYHKDGKNWFSSCSNREDLLHWYSLKDALDLISKGFVFTRYLATEYVEYELETTFIKETSLAREIINIEELFESEETKMKISKTTKVAEWKKVEGVDHNVYHCENCGLLWYMSNKGTPVDNEMNFCPKCGFKIKVEE